MVWDYFTNLLNVKHHATQAVPWSQSAHTNCLAFKLITKETKL